MRRFTVEQGIAEIALTAHNKETPTIATVIYIQALQIGHQRSIVPAVTHRQHLTPGAAIGRCSKFMNAPFLDRKSTRLNSSHVRISYAVFCLKKKKIAPTIHKHLPRILSA